MRPEPDHNTAGLVVCLVLLWMAGTWLLITVMEYRGGVAPTSVGRWASPGVVDDRR